MKTRLQTYFPTIFPAKQVLIAKKLIWVDRQPSQRTRDNRKFKIQLSEFPAQEREGEQAEEAVVAVAAAAVEEDAAVAVAAAERQCALTFAVSPPIQRTRLTISWLAPLAALMQEIFAFMLSQRMGRRFLVRSPQRLMKMETSLP